MKVSMEEVFDVIREERDYQDKLWGNAPSSGRHSISEFILFMEDYLQEARNTVSRFASPQCDEDALHSLRKVASMAVACMEQNGVQRRNMQDLDNACEVHGVCAEE